MGHSFSIKYLPPEIWRDILSNLPVKTLLRFRRVCKSWCSIIDHPGFAYELKRHKLNSNTSKIFAIEEVRCYGKQGCLLTDRQGDTLQRTAQILESSEVYFVVGRCNELLLMRCYLTAIGIDREEMSLWNPSIRKSLLIPPCPLPNAMCVFGFAPRSKDYKVIAISYGQCPVTLSMQAMQPTEIYVAVFTLNDKKWAIRNNGLDISCNYIYSIFDSYDITIPPRAFYFEGAAHWIGGKPGYQSVHLVSLNFDTEKFTFMEIPAAASDEPETLRFLFLLEESLALFSISYERLRIWVLKQRKGKRVWTKWFSRSSNPDDFKLFFDRGLLYSSILYHESDDGKYFLFWDTSYNISTGQRRKLEPSKINCVDLGLYTESLVLWKGYGAENMASLP